MPARAIRLFNGSSIRQLRRYGVLCQTRGAGATLSDRMRDLRRFLGIEVPNPRSRPLPF
jgi:hypothetical protein